MVACVCARVRMCVRACMCDEKVVAFTKVRLQSIIPTSGCECLLVSEGEQNRQTLSLTDQLMLDLLTTSWKINTFQFEFKKNYSFAPRSHGVGLMKYSASTEGGNPSEKSSADRGEMFTEMKEVHRMDGFHVSYSGIRMLFNYMFLGFNNQAFKCLSVSFSSSRHPRPFLSWNPTSSLISI